MESNVYLFNPTGEMAIANGTISYQAPKHLQTFEQALSYLPAFIADENDTLLVWTDVDPEFKLFWERLNVAFPTILSAKKALADSSFLEQPKNRLRPWCWSAAMHHTLKELKTSCSDQFLAQPNAFWKSEHKELYSRETAKKLLQVTLNKLNSERFLSLGNLPQKCTSAEQVESLMSQFGKLVLKAPWSSSGRGVQVLRHSELNTSVYQWINGTIKQQGFIMVEVLLEKIVDMAFHFEVKKGNVSFAGITYFDTNSNGLYQGNFVNRRPDLPNNAHVFLDDIIPETTQVLLEALSESNIAVEYEGVLGIDALVYKEESQLKLQPCLEINLRYNMGTLALHLEKKIHPKAKGKFNVFFDKKKRFADFVSENSVRKAQLSEGRIRSGFFPLTPPSMYPFGAYLELE